MNLWYCTYTFANTNYYLYLTCSAMMLNNPKQAYCTKFLLRIRTQPPVGAAEEGIRMMMSNEQGCVTIMLLAYNT